MKRAMLIGLLCVAAAIAVMVVGYGVPQPTEVPTVHKLVLLTQSDTGSFLMQLRKGMLAAATPSGTTVSLAVLQPDDPAAQVAALQPTIDGVLLLCADADLSSRAAEACAAQGLPVYAVDGGLSGLSSVQSDDALAGRMMVDWMQRTGYAQAFFLHNGSDAALARRSGASNAWPGLSSLLWPEDAPLPDSLDTQALSEGAVLVALDDSTTLRLATLRRNGFLPVDTCIIGTDPGTDRAVYLEDGILSALVLPDPYAMGYAGLTAFLGELNGGSAPASTYIAPVLVTRQNLYDPETTRCIFPLL